MKTFLIGSACGFALGAAAVFVWLHPTESNLADEAHAPQSTAAFPAGSSVASRTIAPSTGPQTSEPASDQPDVQTIASGSFASTRAPESSRPRSDVGDTAAYLSAARSEIAPQESGAASVSTPIPMTDAHRAMIAKLDDSDAVVRQHASLEQESLDQSWSYTMEQILRGYLAARAPQTGVEIANITCRATACEIQAFDSSEMGLSLSRLLQNATQESWWEFGTMSARTSSQDNRAIAIVFLGRKKTPGGQNKLAALR